VSAARPVYVPSARPLEEVCEVVPEAVASDDVVPAAVGPVAADPDADALGVAAGFGVAAGSAAPPRSP